MPPRASSSAERARRALAAAGLPVDSDLRRAASNANETWIGEAFVLRVNARGDLGRLEREALLAPLLPREARYPGVVAYGKDEQIEWIVTPRVRGTDLARVWPGMSRSERESATRQVAQALRALHAVDHPSLPRDEDMRPPHVLPIARALEMVEALRGVAHLDNELLDGARDHLLACAGALDDDGVGLAHGDMHLENVLWDDGSVSAVLDLEWARRTWIAVDLETLLAFCDHPFVFVVQDLERDAHAGDYAGVPAWLASEYSEAFRHPRLLEQLVALGLIRELGRYEDAPPRAAARAGDVWDARTRARALLDGTSHLHRLFS